MLLAKADGQSCITVLAFATLARVIELLARPGMEWNGEGGKAGGIHHR